MAEHKNPSGEPLPETAQPIGSITSAHSFLYLARIPPRAGFLAAIVLLVLLLCWRWQSLGQLSTHVIGGSERDAGLYLWLSELLPRVLLERAWFNTPAFFPYSLSLGWSDNFLLPALLVSGLSELGLSLVLAYNLTLLFAAWASGFCTFLLCARLTASPAASLLAGATFMVGSFFTSHLGHPQLQFAFWLPLTILATLRCLERPSFLRGFALSACISGAFLTTVYYAIYGALIVVLILAVLLCLRPREMLVRCSVWPLFGAVLPLVVLAPFVLPYLSVQATFGERFLHEPYYFSASLLSYGVASPLNLLYGRFSDLSHSEGHLLIGVSVLITAGLGVTRAFRSNLLARPLILLLLALVTTAAASIPGLFPGHHASLNLVCALLTWISLGALAWFLRRLAYLERISGVSYLSNRSLIALFLAGALVCFLISLGPLGYSEHVPALSVYRFFYEVLPGFSAARAVGRLGVVVFLFLCVLLSLAISLLMRERRCSPSLLIPLFALILIEHAHHDYPREELPRRPLIFDALDSRASNGDVAVVLPFSGETLPSGQVKSWSEFARLQVNAMRFALPTGVPVVNGYSGQRTKIMREWPALLSSFPSEESLRALSEVVGLRWVVVLTPFAQQVESGLPEWKGRVRIVERDDLGNLLIEITAPRLLDTSGARLLVPSFPEGLVSIETSLLPLPGAPEVTVEILDLEDQRVLTAFALTADGSWVSKSFRVGDRHYQVSPLRLGFRPRYPSAERRILYARKSSYEALP